MMAEKDGLTTLISGNFGNSRQYRFEHLLGLWPTSNVLNWPLFSYFPISGSLLTKFLHQISTFHIRVILFLSKNKISTSKDFALTSYILAKRPSPTV